MSATNDDPTFKRTIAGAKRPFEAVSTARRLRSRIPRLKRIPQFPIIAGISNSKFVPELEEESSSSCFHSEVSCDSEVMKRPRPSRMAKSKIPVRSQSSVDEFRRITRSYARKKEMMRSDETMKNESEGGGSGTGVSCGAASSEIQISEVTLATGGDSATNLEAITESSDLTEKFHEISGSSCQESSFSEVKPAKISNSVADVGSSLQIGGDLAVRKQGVYGVDLTCYEQLSDADSEISNYSTCDEMTLSEMEAELFSRSSAGESSECSVLFDSPEGFSEKSSQNSTPSPAFTLFHVLAKQFLKLSFGVDLKEKSVINSSHEFTGLKFDEEDDEESYKSIRSCERKEVFLYDYAEYYSTLTDSGDLILRQRLLMVNWIMEHSEAMELHHETLFLGVSLMDRFLSRGYFDSERNLQLLGIASVTLATRLEEIQPWNSIHQKSFRVGSNVYYRHEVVAMEWLLLEVLNFHCMLPTTHNFLWFYLKAAKADAEVESLTRYLAVISLLDHERLNFWPSTVAAGLVILACLATNQDSSCLRVMETHVRTKSDDLPECIQSLEWLVKYVH